VNKTACRGLLGYRVLTLRNANGKDYGKLKLSDILSVSLLEDELSIRIVSYPYLNRKKKSRAQLSTTLTCENTSLAEKFTKEICKLARIPHPSEKVRRKFLVFINPFGGTGQAKDVFYNSCKPVFDASLTAELEVVETTHLGHAKEYVQSTDVARFAAIVVVSGDGLLNEVVNGLAANAHSANLQIPLGVVAGGSGNGLAATLNALDPVVASFNICKYQPKPLDIMKVSLNDTVQLGFLSVNWAMISDLDFESERYRFVGGFRFTLGAIVRVINLRVYSGKLHYLPLAKDVPRTVCGPRCMVCHQRAPAKREHLHDEVDEHSADGANGGDESGGQVGCEQAPMDARHTCYSPLPTLRIPTRLPQGAELEEWVAVEGEFVLVVAANVAAVSYDAVMAPHAHLSDGCIDLVWVPACARHEITSILLGLETGTHLRHPRLHYQKARAVMITPEGGKGCYDLDGEHVHGPCNTMLIESIPALCRVLAQPDG